MTDDRLEPGYPGRGYDPTRGFSDAQWYFYHRSCVAHFGAFSTSAHDTESLVEMARSLIEAAPQYAEGYRAPTFWEIYPANTAIDIDPANIHTPDQAARR